LINELKPLRAFAILFFPDWIRIVPRKIPASRVDAHHVPHGVPITIRDGIGVGRVKFVLMIEELVGYEQPLLVAEKGALLDEVIDAVDQMGPVVIVFHKRVCRVGKCFTGCVGFRQFL